MATEAAATSDNSLVIPSIGPEPAYRQNDRYVDREGSDISHVQNLKGRERDLKSKQRDADAHHLSCSKRNTRLKQCRGRPDRGENETEDQAPDDGRPGQKRHPGRSAGDKRAEDDTRDISPKPVRFNDPSRPVQHCPTPRDVREVVLAILTRNKQVISRTGIRRPPAISCYLCDRSESSLPQDGFADVDVTTDCRRRTELRGKRRSRLNICDRKRRIVGDRYGGEASAILQMRALHSRALRRTLPRTFPRHRHRGGRGPRLRAEYFVLGWTQSGHLPQKLFGQLG